MADLAPVLATHAKVTGEQWRPQLIAGAGAVVILISAAAALLPVAGELDRASVVGTMMVAAGLVEMIAGALRSRNRALAILPGALTVVAGPLLAFHPVLHKFVFSVWLVIGWLGARGVVLGATTMGTHGSVRTWTLIAAATDLALAAVLLLGLSASTLTLTLFGITPEVIGSFAWVVALSFVATGMLLMEVAACERA